MAWLRIDDAFVENPKIEQLPDKAFRLHVSALCLCARKLTDGHVSTKDARSLGVHLEMAPKRWIQNLCDAGLWRPVPSGWVINDYLDYNPSADEVKRERERNAKRQRDHKERQREIRDSLDQVEGNGVSNAVTDGVSNGSANGAPSPSPPHPQKSVSSSPRLSHYAGDDSGSTLDRIIAICERNDPEAREKILRTRRANQTPEARLLEILFAIRAAGTRNPTRKALSMMTKEAA